MINGSMGLIEIYSRTHNIAITNTLFKKVGNFWTHSTTKDRKRQIDYFIDCKFKDRVLDPAVCNNSIWDLIIGQSV